MLNQAELEAWRATWLQAASPAAQAESSARRLRTMPNQAEFTEWRDALMVAIYKANLLPFPPEGRYARVRQSDTFEIRYSQQTHRYQAFAKRDIKQGEQITKEMPVVRHVEHIYWLESEPRLMSMVLSLELPRTVTTVYRPPGISEIFVDVLRLLGHSEFTAEEVRADVGPDWEQFCNHHIGKPAAIIWRLLDMIWTNSTRSSLWYRPEGFSSNDGGKTTSLDSAHRQLRSTLQHEDDSSVNLATLPEAYKMPCFGLGSDWRYSERKIPLQHRRDGRNLVLYLQSSCMTHSCSPNTVYMDNIVTGARTVSASKNIRAGDVITIPYHDVAGCDWKLRNQMVYERTGMPCHCTVCSRTDPQSEPGIPALSERRRRCIGRTQELVTSLVHLWNQKSNAPQGDEFNGQVSATDLAYLRQSSTMGLFKKTTTNELLLVISDPGITIGVVQALHLHLRIPESGTIPLAGLICRLTWANMMLAYELGIMDGEYRSGCTTLAFYGKNDATHRSELFFSEGLCAVLKLYFSGSDNPLYKECVQWQLKAKRACQRKKAGLKALRKCYVEDLFASEQGFARSQYNLMPVGTLELLDDDDAEEQLAEW